MDLSLLPISEKNSSFLCKKYPILFSKDGKLAIFRIMSTKILRITLKSFSLIPIIFWAVFLFFTYKAINPTITVLRSIAKLENRYYQIDVKNDQPTYLPVKEIPKNWIPYKQISKKAIYAIVVSEDGKFFDHHGYDIEQIQKVMGEKFIYKKKKVRGASTITQQLIKNLYLTKEKSIGRKVKEFVLSDYIEEKVSKNKILESYLNVIEYGKGIYGIENAARFYFKKSAKDLNAKEGAFLAMLLPNPKKYARSFYQRSLTPFAVNTVNSILVKMRQGGYISDAELEAALSSRLSFENSSPAPIDLKSLPDENSADESDTEDLI